jgi:hypothetical protein
MREKTTNEIIRIIYVSSFFSLTLFFFGPAHLYFYNVLEYHFRFAEISLALLALSFLSFSFAAAILLLLYKSSSHKRAISILFTVSFLLWLQGNLLVWDYGILDGKNIDWGAKFIYGIVDGALWIALLAFAALKPSVIYMVVRKGSIALILIQTISLCVLFLQTPKPNLSEYKIDWSKRFNFSSEQNIIILILDAFQTDIFKEIITEDERIRETFRGFTYFPNSVGGYPTTYPSMPLFFTGLYYDNSIPIQDFIKEAYSSNSVPRTLKQMGYDVILPKSKSIYLDSSIYSNLIKRTDFWQFDFKRLSSLLDVTFFRYIPHFGKKHFFNRIQNNLFPYGKSGKHFDISFIEEMMEKSKVAFDANALRAYHLFGTHSPYRLNEDLEYEELEPNRSGLKRQARASLKIVDKFLSVLRKLGIFDRSMIFVIGDHGFGTPESPAFTANDDMAYLAPLIVVKPFESRDDLRISSAPVSLSDIPKTIFSELSRQCENAGICHTNGLTTGTPNICRK